MKTLQSAHFARIAQHGERAHSETFDAFDAVFQPTRYDSRAYEQSDMHAHAIDRFSLSIDTLT
jgi:hypothetical protein